MWKWKCFEFSLDFNVVRFVLRFFVRLIVTMIHSLLWNSPRTFRRFLNECIHFIMKNCRVFVSSETVEDDEKHAQKARKNELRNTTQLPGLRLTLPAVERFRLQNIFFHCVNNVSTSILRFLKTEFFSLRMFMCDKNDYENFQVQRTILLE